ncbi:MAG TPA: hypothetical protein VG389_02555 [Myxococcota bacterium]|jgi:hypothetical protein|nr:hypothetical protein [Myxococcota bacterium]
MNSDRHDRTDASGRTPDEADKPPKARKPYAPPAIESEESFENKALTCGLKGGLTCINMGGTTS